MKSATSFCFTLGDETRWRIALLILDQALCVCELEDALNLAQSTLSSHLKVFRSAGLVEIERKDKWAYYRLDPSVAPLVRALREGFPATGSEARRYRTDAARTAKRVALRGRACRSSASRRPIPPALAFGAAAEGRVLP